MHNQSIKLNILGMSCSHCVKAIENGLSSNEAINSVQIDLDSNLADISYDEEKIDKKIIITQIEKLGYKANSID